MALMSETGNIVDGGDEIDSFHLTGRGAFIHLGEGTALIGPTGETIFYTATVSSIENLFGSIGHDIFVGTDGENVFYSHDGDDLLSGRGGADSLIADDGNDTIVGGRGADSISTGRGEDIIRFDRLVESRPDAPDGIGDFSSRDTIDLSRIDADLTHAGSQAFRLVGEADFSGRPGELRYDIRGADFIVSADADGDRSADLAFRLWGTEYLSETGALTTSDFIL
ncbi:M10 family metallopeptidase C-terminal domain-containing protein [Inquilinus sp. OTU3971]|uniref:M10 family metallopeptidase C-terminal domain-containing protein n=1 Tax=Inquilinus sp. OTU3971 TaxID=3043855 RepID=UPI00313D55B8